jgi:P4 family phage/plasmid primase-like protien
MSAAYERIVERLRELGKRVVERGPDRAMASCPAHEDDQPSLSIKRGRDSVLIFCQAGCKTELVTAAIGWKMADLYNDPMRRNGVDNGVIIEYPYVDESGTVLYIKQRLEPKKFRQYRLLPDGSRSWELNGVRRVLYRLPEVASAKLRREPIYLPEGEKDVHALEGLGAVATTWAEGGWKPGSKSKWRAAYSTLLDGAHVIVIQDQDEAGQQTAQDIALKIAKHAASVKIVKPAVGKDAADHIAAGLGLEDFEDVEMGFLPPLDEVPQDQPAVEFDSGGTFSIYTQTDDGNALHLIDDHADKFRRVADMRRWFVWDGCRWALDHEDRAIRFTARDQARDLPNSTREQQSFKHISMSATGISGCVRVAETDKRTSILARELDAHPELINTPSGIVNLRDGTLRDHDPRLLLTRVTEYPCDLVATHPRWDAFLCTTFNDDQEMIGYLQRLFGLALLGRTHGEILPFFWGKGANGKTVIANVLQGLLGNADAGGYAVGAPDGFLMAGREGKHETEIARLRGARLVITSEQTSGRSFDEVKIKKLTGGDILTGRFMRGDFFDFPPSHLMLVLSNSRPEVREGGDAFWRRVRLIPFPHVVADDQQIKYFHDHLLAAEAPAILGWGVRGAVEVLTNGLQDPKKVIVATEEYRTTEDTVASFVRDHCLLGEFYTVRVAGLRRRFERHCRELGMKDTDVMSAKALTQRLTTEYPVTSGQGSKGVRVYRGIGLLDLDDEAEQEEQREWYR